MRVDAGNEYQNKQYKLRFNFVATADELVGTLTIRYVDQDGNGIFYCKDGSVSVWIKQGQQVN
jgi:hypothetical protein